MEKIDTLSIDIESFSDRDLRKCGVYRYSESPNAELLLFGYSVNNGPVEVIDVAQGEEIPECILEALVDGKLCSYLMPCPRIPRNTVLEAEITVYSESSADCRFSSPAALYLAN